MKKVLIAALMVLLASVAFAQELKVLEFRADMTMTDAVKYPKEDANGVRCGLIRMGLVIPDAQFEGDIISSEYKDGEWWVYMMKGANWITIMTKKYLPLRHEFDPIESNVTYVMNIERPQIAYDGPTGTVKIESNIKDVDVYVDGEKMSSVAPYEYKGPEGKHDIELRAKGYNDERQTVDIQLNKKITCSMTMHAAGTFSLDGISYEMVKVAGGTFTMGTTEVLNKANFNVATPHDVVLRNYSIGATEVSQALWEKVMGSNPSVYQGEPNRPVENVTYDDCLEFIKRLNARCGTHFRLPTEAEWEFAARARGTNDGQKAPKGSIYKTNTPGLVSACGENALKIKGMAGNVAEWCSDWFGYYPTERTVNPSGPDRGWHRVIRGGSYDTPTDYPLRATTRSHMDPNDSSPTVGFRLAMDD